MTEKEIVQKQLETMERQELALAKQADAILEQLTMTKGAVQILRQVLIDIESVTTEETQS